MSELIKYPKSYVYDQLGNKPRGNLYYLKYEADKVIADLEKNLDLYKRGFKEDDRINAYLYAELRHQKYRRCLAMASTCRLRARWFGDNFFYKKEQWALKWHRRWLELAEKFKEKP